MLVRVFETYRRCDEEEKRHLGDRGEGGKETGGESESSFHER
jgi:hypothetical protein